MFALAIDPEAALLEYLDIFYHLGRAGKALDRFGVIDFATTVAPGVRDVLVVGKVYEATRRGAPGRSARATKGSQTSYDAVVLDAPPTGRIGRFLNVNTEVAGIAKVGPIRNQASSIMRLLKSDVTTVHVVTTLEEMPVQETLDGIDELRQIGLGVGALLVNQVRGSDLSSRDLRSAVAGTLDDGEVETALKEAGITAGEEARPGLCSTRPTTTRSGSGSNATSASGSTRPARPTATLPYVYDGIDLGTLYDFADTLRSAGIV